MKEMMSSDEILSLVMNIHSQQEDFIEGDLSERIEQVSKYELKEINLDSIPLNEWHHCDSIIQEYMELPMNTMPTSIIHDYGNFLSIVDGTHRLNALKRMGIKTVLVYVGKIK